MGRSSGTIVAMRRIVAAPDKFRGTATAREIAYAMGEGATAAGWSATLLPMADGGEGLLDVVGGSRRHTEVSGPLGATVDAEWRLLGTTAVVEMARASGLSLVSGPSGNDPVAASTAGTGELIAAAVAAGARRVVVGVGGSATTDGGLGAVRALGSGARLHGVELEVACDVTTRFVEAASVFGPQKGATAAQVELLRRRLDRLAQVYLDEFGVDVREIPGSGAAGGLAGGLAALGATLVPGCEAVAEALGLEDAMVGASLAVTGEGLLDPQSFEGKVVGGVASMARREGLGTLAVVGDVVEGGVELPPGLAVVSLVDRFGRERALSDPVPLVVEAVGAQLAELVDGATPVPDARSAPGDSGPT
jgi:glycerate 2-kinase